MKQSSPYNDDDTQSTNTFTQLASLQAPELLPQTRAATATPRLEKSESNIFYLAYGSNLCSATFLGRRGIRPISSTNVRVPSLHLTFDLPGLAYLEPCFANVSTSPPKDKSWWKTGLVGVVYEVTPDDFARILATEGGGAAYTLHTALALPLDGGEEVLATTLLAPEERKRHTNAQPSRRYLDLLRTGARENGLPGEYCAWLDGLKEYRKTSVRQWVGALVWGLLWQPAVMVVMVLARVCADAEGRVPAWLAGLQSGLWCAMWAVYDGGFKQVWGDGERTVESGERERLLKGGGVGMEKDGGGGKEKVRRRLKVEG